MGFSSLAGAGISGISSLLGASQVSGAADKAAQAQAVAGQNATNALTGALGTSTAQLSPYTGTGSQAVQTLGNDLTTLAGASSAPSTRYVDPSQFTTSGTANNISGTANNISAAGTAMDPTAYGVSADGYGTDASQFATSADPYKTSTSISQADLEATPGYQFTLNQGEKAVQNSAAARGLGVSGAALKGAATYATGLSDQTYNTRFGQEQSANAQNFGQELQANQAGFGNALAANGQNYDLTSKAAGQNFSQQLEADGQNFNQLQGAATTNFGQEATAASTNYGQQQGANTANASNALTAAGQNFGQDQTGFTDAQSGKAQSANILGGAAGIGLSATGQQVQANTATGIGTANALTGVGTAQAAADNASGQAYGAAATGVGNALTGGMGNYNGYQIASAINPNIAGANTFGNALTNALGGNNNSGFLGTVASAVKKNTTGNPLSPSMNV